MISDCDSHCFLLISCLLTNKKASFPSVYKFVQVHTPNNNGDHVTEDVVRIKDESISEIMLTGQHSLSHCVQRTENCGGL